MNNIFFKKNIISFIAIFIFMNNYHYNYDNIEKFDKVVSFSGAFLMERILNYIIYDYGLGIKENDKKKSYNFENYNCYEESLKNFQKTLKEFVTNNIIGASIFSSCSNFYNDLINFRNKKKLVIFSSSFLNTSKIISLSKNLISLKSQINNINKVDVLGSALVGVANFKLSGDITNKLVDKGFKSFIKSSKIDNRNNFSKENLAKSFSKLVIKNNLISPILFLLISKVSLLSSKLINKKSFTKEELDLLNEKYNNNLNIASTTKSSIDIYNFFYNIYNL